MNSSFLRSKKTIPPPPYPSYNLYDNTKERIQKHDQFHQLRKASVIREQEPGKNSIKSLCLILVNVNGMVNDLFCRTSFCLKFDRLSSSPAEVAKSIIRLEQRAARLLKIGFPRCLIVFTLHSADVKNNPFIRINTSTSSLSSI